jgi:hypothetical protein
MKALKIILLLFASMQTIVSAKESSMTHPLDNMPILEQLPKRNYGTSPPVEQRGVEFRRFLSTSVKIQVQGGSGSGTIIYYDEEKNLAYVASCGHLWNNGVVSAEDAKKKNIKCKIVVWYKNDKKLEKTEQFDAKLLFYSHTNEIDTSLLVFSPNWKPEYLSIAPINYKYKFNSTAHSCGCDGGSEVAHYEVKLLELNDDIVTIKNSPRPGRSGGGLFDENFYIGTCWGTQYVDGSGNGYFTPIKDIHSFWSKQKGYEFLLTGRMNLKAKLIPVVNKNEPNVQYTQDYILAP